MGPAMSASPDLGPEMSAFRAALKARGLSATTQRMAIAETLFSAHDHLTADDLYERVRKRDPKVGRVTVYRTLAVLVEAGLAEERPFRKDRMLYEHTVGHRHHDHMVCISCGLILEFENPRIEREQEASARKAGFTVYHHSHTLFGACRACAGKRPLSR